MKGGLIWREGADACIFKPSIACREDPINYPSDMPNMISRVIDYREPDIRNEANIEKYFPLLVQRGFVNIRRKACTPDFKQTNFKPSVSYQSSSQGPCARISPSPFLVNLITPEFTNNLAFYLKDERVNIEGALKYLRGAICAAIGLVPDNGVWVIHGDLHLENVLIQLELNTKTKVSQTYTSLSDWTRIIIFNSKDIHSIYRGIDNYLKLQSAKWGPFLTFKEISEVPQIQTGKLEQFSIRVLQTLHRFHKEYTLYKIVSAETYQSTLSYLRGFMPFILLRQIFTLYKQSNPSWFDLLFKTNSQQELIQVINTHMPKIAGEDYYTERYIRNEPFVPFSNNKPLYANLGGKRRTRRQKRKGTKKRRI